MNKRVVVGATLTIVGLMTATLFQNCGQGFQASGNNASNSEASVSSPANSAVDISHSDPHIVPLSTSIAPAVNMQFSVTADSLPSSVSYAWTYTLNGMASGCSVTGSANAAMYTINCASAGELVVDANLMSGSQSIEVPAYDAILATGTGQSSTGISLSVNFTVQPGTGTKAWNTSAAPVEVFIGQTLVLTNNDTVNQQLHTNGVPFPHGTLMAPGTSTNNVVMASYSSAANGMVYNHLVGTSAPFYMVAYDGGALYATNCASCHGALSASAEKNATVATIKAGITSVQAMKTPALMALTERQLEAISYSLGAR